MKRGEARTTNERPIPFSTFTDWCAEQTSFPEDVREMALTHQVSDKGEAAYRRGDLFMKRRAMAGTRAGYCARLPRSSALRLRCARS